MAGPRNSYSVKYEALRVYRKTGPFSSSNAWRHIVKKLLGLVVLSALSTVPVMAQWSLQQSPVTSRLYDIKFSGGRGLMVGDSVVLVSGDTGSSWAIQDFPGNWGFTQCTIQCHDSLWVAGWMIDSRKNVLLRSTDGGTTWSVVDTSLHDLAGTSVFFKDKTHGWVGGSGSGFGADTMGWVSKTTDGGATWQKTDRTLDLINDVFFSDTLHGWACSEGGNVYKSTDGGETWNFNYLALNGSIAEPLRHVQFTTIDSGWASGGIGGVQTVLRTVDAGQSWQIATTQGNVASVYGMMFSDSRHGWMVGGWGGTSRIAYTSDGGSTWSLQPDPVPMSTSTGWYFGVYMFDNRNGFIVGSGGTILKTSNGGTTDAVQTMNERPSDFQLLQNFPNPFNPSTNISFSLPERAVVRLTVFDLLGRTAATLVNGEYLNGGTHTIKWDAADFPSGVYFYKLEAGNISQTRKLLLLR